MDSLLAEVLPLAFGAAISPVLFLLQIATLTGKRPLARGTAVAVGAAIPLLVVGAIGVSVGVTHHGPTDSTPKIVIELVLGAALVGLGIRTATREPKPKAHKDHGSGNVAESFVFGALAMLTNFSTFALFIPAMSVIATKHVSDTDRIVAATIVVLVTLVGVLGPLLLTATMPRASGRVLHAVGDVLTKHRRAMSVVICFVFGIYLLYKGVVGL